MPPLLGDYLANLAAELSAHVLAAVPAWVQTTWQGDETDQAVRRCLDAGVAAFVRRASADAPAYSELWDLIFPRFFHDEQVAGQVVRLLEGQRLNRRALQYMAADAGYAPDRFAGMDFDAALQEFEGAFLMQATHEPALQGTISANQLLQQTRLLAETKAMLAKMVTLLQEVSLREIVGIEAEQITATNVVSGTQIVYQLAATANDAPAPFPAHWETHYLQALVAHCGGLDLTPLAAAEAGHDALSIASVFTTLYLDGVTRAADEPLTDVIRPAQAQREVDDKAAEPRMTTRREQERLPVTAVEAAAGVSRLVILGEPGGGKSTLVNHMATQLARRRLGEPSAQLPGWPDGNAPLPVRIVLRRFAAWLGREGRIFGSAGDVWDYLAYLLQQWGCGDSFDGIKQALIAEGGVVFFDGLDEIRGADVRFSVLKGAVANFAATEAPCRVIVTSRPYAYTRQSEWRLPDDRFAVVSLAPFGPEQIETFCRAWYLQAIRPRRGWNTDQCERRAGWLARTVTNRPHLRRLAASPLLLTLIAQVDSSGPEAMLPNNRADLYRQMVGLLLARWENRIQLDSRPGQTVPEDEILWLEGVPTQEVQYVLAQLAFAGHAQQGQQEGVGADGDEPPAVEIERDRLEQALAKQFDSYRQAQQIIIYIQHRAGLLVDKGAGVFTFPHRTYQEYLAAQYLLNQSDGLEQLCRRVKAQPDWWREIFLLSAGSGMTMPKNVQDLINTLLPFAPGAPEMPLTADAAVWSGMAAQALWETNFQSHVLREQPPGGFTAVYRRVQGWLQAIMVADERLPAAVRAEAGQWLARLGDERPGVGIDPKTGLPDIVWSAEIPAGRCTIGDDRGGSGEKIRQVQIKRPFRLARYPITNAQFQAFVDAADRGEAAWWQGLPDKERELSDSRYPFANHPRETVSWYQAVAFCRWLTAKLHAGALQAEQLDGDLTQYTISLPHEHEWEVAARWPNNDVQQRIYPWGPEFDAAKANTGEGENVGQTTAVGIYPSGQNAALELYDLSGNVWEWCRNRYNAPEEDTDPAQFDLSSSFRVLRGGSFYDARHDSRAAYRDSDLPASRDGFNGFRVVVARRPPS